MPADSDQPTSRKIVRRILVDPFTRFLEIEAASGIVLAVATLVALVWANVVSAHSYASFFEWSPQVSGAGELGKLDLRGLIDDALMAVFFFVVGLEIKREWLEGALRDRRFARLPVVAALGGMIVPAVLYTMVAHGTAGAHGWGIPMATDIAFVVGVMALLGDRVPSPIKVFLLTLAIVDDLGAIVVIALFYSRGLQWFWLLSAAVGLGALAGFRRGGVRTTWWYGCIAVAVWYCTWQSGVHATIAGVAVAFVTPMRIGDGAGQWSPLNRLLEWLHPWSSYVVVPVFALANAGVDLTHGVSGDGARVALGIVVGLVVGKTIGVLGASWLAVRLRFASLPDPIGWQALAAAGMLAGIGFTMSLFITELAFTGGEAMELTTDARKAILAASTVAAVLGSFAFVILSRRARGSTIRDEAADW